jgi:hypothetical protein
MFTGHAGSQNKYRDKSTDKDWGKFFLKRVIYSSDISNGNSYGLFVTPYDMVVSFISTESLG